MLRLITPSFKLYYSKATFFLNMCVINIMRYHSTKSFKHLVYNSSNNCNLNTWNQYVFISTKCPLFSYSWAMFQGPSLFFLTEVNPALSQSLQTYRSTKYICSIHKILRHTICNFKADNIIEILHEQHITSKMNTTCPMKITLFFY